MDMTIRDIICNVIAGGLLGILGQGIRIAVGLKKFNEDNTMAAVKGQATEPFSASRLMVSIFIGFAAGAMGMLVNPVAGDKTYNTQGIITIIAIGYSGSDFIEGFFNTYIKKFDNSTATPVANVLPVNATTTTTTVTAPAAIINPVTETIPPPDADVPVG
jgi:hypothetical protein